MEVNLINTQNQNNDESQNVKLSKEDVEMLQKITLSNVLEYMKNNPDQFSTFQNINQIFEQICALTPNEDSYFQTILAIYVFLGQKYSIATILNALHQSAGNVKKAIQKLLQNTYRPDESCDFSYYKIYSMPKNDIDAYFSIN